MDALAIALIVLALSDWVWTAVLVYAARQQPEPALVERASTGVILSFVATIAAILGAIRLGLVIPPEGTAILLLSLALLLVSAPQWLWGIGLLAGKFR